ncbi:Ig-like domain-containing protein [Pontibacter sp. MBLB2868]|uniref:Ig-like domain-containing protein n=1 Tax=Pontibacter sp. MBLB2868 TaxID=3451555 RepID=UPI003F75331A
MPEFYKHWLLRPFAVILFIALPGGAFSMSNHVAAPLISLALAAPTLQAQPSLVGAISVRWSQVSSATGYVLEMSTSGDDATFIPLKTFGSSETTFRHTGLYYNQKIYYRIKALGSGVQSPYSAIASATTHAQSKVFNIMPLGDSNTEGGSSTMATDQKASYRSKLEQLLNGSSSKGHYDFVGGEQSGSAYVTDVDHAGLGAARNEDIVSLLRYGSYERWYDKKHMGLDYTANYLEVFSPDIILLHLGTNDISNEGVDNSQISIDNMKLILDEIDKYEQKTGKEVTVILAKIIQTVCTPDFCYKGDSGTKNDIINIYNSKIEALANQRISNGDRLILVDMADAGIIYQFEDHGGEMADPMHPTLAGYNKMAPIWFAELDKLLNTQPQAQDTQAPETTITSKPDAQSNSVSASFSFTSNEPGVLYQVSLDGAPFIFSSNPYTISGLSEGNHTLQVRAIDKAGNVDPTPAAYTWLVDTKAPAAPLVQVPTENVLLNNNKPTISGTAEAGATVSVSEGNTQLGITTAAANGAWSLVPAVALAEGSHQISAKATDAAGNTSSASASRGFSIDTKAPETTITSGPPAVSGTTDAVFNFSSSEANVTYQASINGAAFKVVTNPFQLSGLSDSNNELKVKAVDAAGNADLSPATYSWVIDTKAPDAPVISYVSEDRGPVADDGVTNAKSIKLTGEAEGGTEVTVFSLGKEIGRVKATAAGTWTYDFGSATLAEGTYHFTAKATDAAGNTSVSSADFIVKIDLTAPAATLSADSESPVSGAFMVRVIFTEEVFGLDISDFKVTNGSLSGLKLISDATYEVKVTPAADGTVAISLPGGKVTDLAGNQNAASESIALIYDATGAEIVLASDAPATINKAFTVTFTFSEAVTGFTVADISVGNGAANNFSAQSATTYTALINPETDGEVSVRVAADVAFDEAANGNTASAELKRLYDTKRPDITLSTSAANPLNKPFTVNINLTEAVADLELADITVKNGAASQLNKTGNTSYTVLITPAASGEVEVSIAANMVHDPAENGNTASNSLHVDYDAGRPAVTLSADAAGITNAPFTVTFKISEGIEDFDMADIVLTNATAEDLSQVSPSEYTVLIRPASEGQVKVSMPADRVHDVAGNGNTASNILEIRYDAVAPAGYAVSFTVDQIDVRNHKQVSFEVTGAEKGATYTFKISSSNGAEEVTGSATVANTTFTVSDLDLSHLSDGTITVVFYLVDDAGNKGAEVKDEAQKITRNVVAVHSFDVMKVPFKTKFTQLNLPDKAQVTYANGEEEELKIVWEEGKYNGNKPGQYVLTGHLELPTNSTNTNNIAASITVEVAPNKPPTAIHFSSATFKPDLQPEEPIGSFSTTDLDDADFTYALVSGAGDTHNDLFEIINNELYLKSNQGLSGTSDFTIRVRSTDPYQNKIEANFTLQKSLYLGFKKVELVNAFSPDGDGINDTWKIPELKYFNEVEVEVFDRAGNRLFHTTDPEEGWNGQGKDGQVKQGAYFYIIQVKEIGLVQKGVVTVLK